MSLWIQRWAGSYTFLSCTYWAKQYYFTLNRILGKGIDSAIFICRRGTASFFVKKNHLDNFGKHLSEATVKNFTIANEMLANLKESTDSITNIMQNLHGRILSLSEYTGFLSYFEKHIAYHNFMKKTVEYLPADILETLISEFQAARIYSEKVYTNTEEFFRAFAKKIAEKEKYDSNAITCLTQEELEQYILYGKLPSEKLLMKRFEGCVISMKKGKICVNFNTKNIEDEVIGNKKNVKGLVAYPGKVRGICRIVRDPFAEQSFNDGDILITGMTRPEFMKFIVKAGAIVTDVGGMLCHAAIIAREMKKPCIIGTGNATKTLTDGVMVEVDAHKGNIKVIK